MLFQFQNSIRHNLSLYNIFERESKKRHGAYWTIKPDLEPKTKQYKDRYKDIGRSQICIFKTHVRLLNQNLPSNIDILKRLGRRTPQVRRPGFDPYCRKAVPFSKAHYFTVSTGYRAFLRGGPLALASKFWSWAN